MCKCVTVTVTISILLLLIFVVCMSECYSIECGKTQTKLPRSVISTRRYNTTQHKFNVQYVKCGKKCKIKLAVASHLVLGLISSDSLATKVMQALISFTFDTRCCLFFFQDTINTQCGYKIREPDLTVSECLVCS